MSDGPDSFARMAVAGLVNRGIDVMHPTQRGRRMREWPADRVL